MIEVGIIEDDKDIREHLGLLIDEHPDFSCNKLFYNVESALDALLIHPPDVLLLDITLAEGMDGIQGVSLFVEKEAPFEIIMFSVHQDDEKVFQSLCAGACGYLTKNTPIPKILSAIKEAHHGGAPMSMQIARMVVQSFRSKQKPDLSPREKDVLIELCNGKSYKKVGECLFISQDTVRTHIRNIYRKLKVNSKAGAVAKALKERLV
ncbi:MAG: DNA-binding response regulator [Saprospiraceae bacterium]|nr:MAG: DNA-binding response regulator [Saprospiraceae bacterium]